MKYANLINIEDAISRLVSDESLFTAYDVTKILRHAGYHVKHSEVRAAVRDFDFPYEYREGVDSSIGAIVHYHMDNDLDDYNPNDIPEFVVSLSGGKGAMYIPSATIKIVDKRSRFCVPASKLRDAGFTKGMNVKVLVEDDTIVIHNGTDGATVTVDKSNNIRIAKGTLQNAFDSLPSKINIDVKDSKVTLSID